jgi:hypothetical protein
MLDEDRRCPRYVDVVLEQDAGVDDIQELNVGTVPAKKDVQWIALLRLR